MKRRGNIFIRLLWVGFVALALFSIVSSQLEINELDKELAELENEVIAVQDSVDELEYELEKPIDDEYITRIAREKFGFHLPGETIFYYDARK